jgi:hypothetical protein
MKSRVSRLLGIVISATAMPAALAGYQLGDVNCDGAVNGFDIDPFVLALVDPGAYAAQYPSCTVARADCDLSGSVDGFDIDPFVRFLLTGPPSLADAWYEGCDGLDEVCPEDVIELTAQPETLYAVHLNGFYNCCAEDILISVNVEGATVHFTEEDYTPFPCYCYCCFTSGATVTGLIPGLYTVEYCWYNYETWEPHCESQEIAIP